MSQIHRTVLYDRHVAGGAKMIEFAGWEMPVQYPTGIVAEHLATRTGAGLFDVSHMGRFVVAGRGALDFLQHVLTGNAAALDVGTAQYTMIPNPAGGAIDDAYLYRFVEEEFLLVVNAANRPGDWRHLQAQAEHFEGVTLTDRTMEVAMLSLQGPASREILAGVLEAGAAPEPVRNALSIARIGRREVRIGRTGYAGEPVGFELFLPAESAPRVWDRLVEAGAVPVGLGARDTLRLEASLPLYGHELGTDPEGADIPIMAVPLAKFAVSFSPAKGEFIGRVSLEAQSAALERFAEGDFSRIVELPRRIHSVALTGRGVARAGAHVFRGDRCVGYVTSGTTVPYWEASGRGLSRRLADTHRLRSIALAYLDSDVEIDQPVAVEVRGKRIEAVVVAYHLRSDAPPYARPIVMGDVPEAPPLPAGQGAPAVRRLLEQAVENTRWRRRQCMNLIPSEMTASPMVRLLSVMDPSFRYAEHKPAKAFYDAEIFYYQGTDFIEQVERLLEEELRKYLGCPDVETRVISGQMANAAVFSAMVDFLNRHDRRREPRRIGRVMNNSLGRGGHLSAQPMGALRDYVAHDPRTERPAVVNFPVRADNPYANDVPATLKLIEEYRPELILFGKSMVLHPEPVAEVRAFLDERKIDAVLMYDMAHVLGLVGPHFQQPFAEGADVVTGSTHKTFFGTQRGVIGCRFAPHDGRYSLWEAVRRRTFPGAVSNHHLGTLLGLLMAAYEMNHFKDEYQQAVLANAKAFARALARAGLEVAGDPGIGYTQTHQVVVEVGYGRGPEIARRLEDSHIICNYQATPDEEGFTASGALRMGVAEMTRFGMGADDFAELAQLLRDVVIDNADVRDKVTALRGRFLGLRYCFDGAEYADLLQQLHELL